MDKPIRRHPVKFVQMMPSSAHTYGNAVAFIQKWLIDQFPKKEDGSSIFKTINVSSKIAHRQLRRVNEINKNNKPALMLRPRIDFSDDRFLQGTALTDKLLLNSINYGPDGLQPFFHDNRKKISIKYQLNRTVMYVDVIMVFSTLMQQLNYATYLKNTIPMNSPFDLDTCFESFLSKELMEMVSDLSGVPMDNNGSVKNFLSYMNQNSNTPVTYKLQGSTNSDEFYRYYPVKIITTIPNFDIDDGERNGQINDNYQITFSIRMEFYTNGIYFLFSDNVFKVKKPTIPDDSSIIPIFTDVLLREDWDLKIGWSQYNRATCGLSKVNDEIDFSSLLSPAIATAISYYKKYNYYIGEIVDIRIREQGRMMSPGTEYWVDFDNLIIHFNNKEYGYLTYTIMICINPEIINNLIKKEFGLK